MQASLRNAHGITVYRGVAADPEARILVFRSGRYQLVRDVVVGVPFVNWRRMDAHTHLVFVTPDELEELLERAARDGAAQALAENAPAAGWQDVRRIADYLAISPNAVRQLVRRRDNPLPCERTPTGRLLFSTRAVDSWVTSQEAA